MQYRKTYFSDGNFHFIPFGIPLCGNSSENLLLKSLIPLGKESFCISFSVDLMPQFDINIQKFQ
jgi:hypothetical protein